MATLPEWFLLLSRLLLEQVPFQNPPVWRSEFSLNVVRTQNSSHGLPCFTFRLGYPYPVKEQDKLLNGECI